MPFSLRRSSAALARSVWRGLTRQRRAPIGSPSLSPPRSPIGSPSRSAPRAQIGSPSPSPPPSRAPNRSPAPSSTATLVDPAFVATIRQVQRSITQLGFTSQVPHATWTNWHAELQGASALIIQGVSPSAEHNPHRAAQKAFEKARTAFNWNTAHATVNNRLNTAQQYIHQGRLVDAYWEVKDAEYWIATAIAVFSTTPAYAFYA